jgi:eukaryotic-like serine/threonine-protein kinase
VALTTGLRIGAYEIVSPLGVGGMGEVYRARDTKLNRDVALKVLPEAFSLDPDRLARFKREAQVLASLNHPNIAHIHGLEDSTAISALVMELVEGPTLADRIAKGPIPLDEALPIAGQIAEALEAAHEQGIIHRDLKPANVKVRADGTVKVLDFGLAKALEPTTASVPVNVTASPTITSPAMMTGVGAILGTAAYMAPEQARGKTVDKRADIWAFGCVLYEMLSGRRAFAGEDVSDTLAYVITKDVDWSALPADTPAHIHRLLRRCIEKDPKRRLRDIGEARIALEDSGLRDELPGAATAAAAGPQPSIARRALPWVAGLAAGSAVAALITWTMTRPRAAASRPVQRFTVTTPSTIRYVGELGGMLAISPDGTRLVYPAIEAGKRLLYIHSFDQFDAQPIRGTDDAFNPFFSPDGEWIAFFTAAGTTSSGGKLKKVSVRGGAPLTVADTNTPTGVWNADGTIVFTRGEADGMSLFRVPAAGGTPTRLTTPEQALSRHAWPDALPGGRNILFSIATGTGNFEDSHIAVLSLDTGKYRTIVEQGYGARYVPSGHIVYALAGNLMAVPFDAGRLETTGPPVPIVEGVRGRVVTGEVLFGVSATGFLVYAPGASRGPERTLVWVDRSGKEEPIPVPPREYVYPRLSPDGTKIALDIRDQGADIWVWDFERRTLTQLTFDPATDASPVWTPDGKRIIFASARASNILHLYWQAADGTGQAERLLETTLPQVPQSISPDGARLVFRQVNPKTAMDLYTLPLTGERRTVPLLQTSFSEQNAEISSDGRWVAYQSNESGQVEVFVRPFPNTDGGKWKISTSGGTRPLWSRDGRELFYMTMSDNLPRLMAATISAGAGFSASAPHMLFEGRYYAVVGGTPGRTYDVSPDGKRFLMIKDLGSETTSTDAPLVVVLNFFDDLRRIAPATKR